MLLFRSGKEDIITLSTEVPMPCTAPSSKNGYSIPKLSSLPEKQNDVGNCTAAYNTLYTCNSRYDYPLCVEKLQVLSFGNREIDRLKSAFIEPDKSDFKLEKASPSTFSSLERPLLSSSDLNIGSHIKNTTNISLERTICLNHVALVDFCNRVW